MPPNSSRSSTRGRGRTRSRTPSHPSSNPPLAPQLCPFVSTPYTPSVNHQQSVQPSQPEVLSLSLPSLPAVHQQTEEERVEQRLDRAAVMIQTSGNEIDVLSHHQQRRNVSVPSQNRLREFAPLPYPKPLLDATSSQLSSTSTTRSHISYFPSQYGETRTKSAPKISLYDKTTQKIVRAARLLVINDMIHDVGWLYGEDRRAAFEGNMQENFAATCIDNKRELEWDDNFGFLVAKGVTSIRSKLAEFAERYAKEYFNSLPTAINAKADRAAEIDWMQQHMNIIMDQCDHLNCFLHEHNETGDGMFYFGNHILQAFHVAFWYTRNESPIRSFKDSYFTTPPPMLALSAAALLCAIHRVASGQESGTTPTPIKFEGTKYGPYYDVFLEGINETRLHHQLGAEFKGRLQSLHKEGMKLLDARCGGPGSPRKVAAVYIPASVRATTHQPSLVADAGDSPPDLFAGHSTQPDSVAHVATSSASYGLPLSGPPPADQFVDHSLFDQYQASSSSGYARYSQPCDIPSLTSANPHEGDQAEIFPYSYFGDV
ncbi:hypothetical protein J3R83DRAFT_7604 [Lanmaoa asiatica]|nr:hypothetical protein J3R83DRAFT_7604 [Lanmaoa asiatica]